jgi:hypothetical protein
MRVGWRTYRVRCSDGRKLTVHRDINAAFPLFLPSLAARGAGSIRDLGGNGVALEAELKTGVDGVLYQLNELNDTVMMNFRAVYATYQADPCRHSDFLARKVDEMTSDLQRLSAIRLELKALIDLAVANPGTPKQVWSLFAEIVTKNNLPGLPQASALRIENARGDAVRWIEGKDG